MTDLSAFFSAHMFCEFEKLYKFKVILAGLLAKWDKKVLARAIEIRKQKCGGSTQLSLN